MVSIHYYRLTADLLTICWYPTVFYIFILKNITLRASTMVACRWFRTIQWWVYFLSIEAAELTRSPPSSPTFQPTRNGCWIRPKRNRRLASQRLGQRRWRRWRQKRLHHVEASAICSKWLLKMIASRLPARSSVHCQTAISLSALTPAHLSTTSASSANLF